MPMSRQKQGIGGNSSIAYKRWEPLDENDIEDNDADYENGNLDTGQVKFHQFEEDLSGECDNWTQNNNYSSVSTIPDLNFPSLSSSNKTSRSSSFTQKLSNIFHRNHSKTSSQRPGQTSSGYNWRKRPPWYGGQQNEESNTLSEKQIGSYTLTNSPNHSSRNQAYLERRLEQYEKSASYWNLSIKILAVMVIFGIGWIVGFCVRWGVHHYYIDAKGHCVAPRLYSYDPEITQDAMNNVNLTYIMNFFNQYTNFHGGIGENISAIHRVGTLESKKFAKKIEASFQDFGLKKTEIEMVNKIIPGTNLEGQNELTIKDSDGGVLWKKSFEIGSNDHQVMYSASAKGVGALVYGHYGRLEDLNHFVVNCGLNFNGSVVLLRTRSSLYHVGSMVRNVELYGAAAVVLFPDPISYIMTQDGATGNLPTDVTLTHSVKYFPGDPASPYIDDISSKHSKVTPNIPVVSISIEDARTILSNFTYAGNVSSGINKDYWFGLPLKPNSNSLSSDYKATVIVTHSKGKNVTLNNVLASIPGRYEPTRYVIIGSHHDAFHEGASRPAVGHAVFMEIVRVLGTLYKNNMWVPGRSILFASWDGEELGGLGSTSWLYRHSKELTSRAVAYINLDYLLQGFDDLFVYSSPLMSDIIAKAAKSVSCSNDALASVEEKSGTQYRNGSSKPCSLFDRWLQKYNSTNSTINAFTLERDANTIDAINIPGQRIAFSSGSSSFENILGISTIDITVKNRHSSTGDGYPFVASSHDITMHAKTFLKFEHAEIIAKFLVHVIMQLLDSAKLDLSATAYAEDIRKGINDFLSVNADSLDKKFGHQHIADLQHAANKFINVAKEFHSLQYEQPALELLGHHEYNDQLMELERAFLLPSFASQSYQKGGPLFSRILSTSPFRHLIHGPSPLNIAHLEFLPRLSAAIQIAKIEDTEPSWNAVQREVFYAIDALESASCVLSNHLIHSHE